MPEQPLLNQRRTERKAFPDRPTGLNGWKLVILAVGAGLLIVAFFFWRAHEQAAADSKLCKKIDKGTVALITFVQSSPAPKKGTKRRADYDRFLAGERAALCNPKNLPTTKR